MCDNLCECLNWGVEYGLEEEEGEEVVHSSMGNNKPFHANGQILVDGHGQQMQRGDGAQHTKDEMNGKTGVVGAGPSGKDGGDLQQNEQ